jgi:pseudo-rSAM protein
MKHKKYWFSILPHVYFEQKKDKALLYNTRTGTYLMTNNTIIINLLLKMQEKTNLGVIEIDETIFQQHDIEMFISESTKQNICKLTDTKTCPRKPVQLMPILNLQRDVEKIAKENDHMTGEIVANYISDITIYLNNYCVSGCNGCKSYHRQFFCCFAQENQIEMDFSIFQRVINQLSTLSLRRFAISGGNIFKYTYIKDIISFFLEKNFSPTFGIHYKNISQENEKLIHDFPAEFFVNFPCDMDKLNRLFPFMTDKHIFNFIVKSETDMISANSIINDFQLKNYKTTPFHNDNNDILKTCLFDRRRYLEYS